MNGRIALLLPAMIACAALPVLAQGSSPSSVPPAQRRVFFGDLHLHTVMSFDAWVFGGRAMPDQAYKFAKGQTVTVQGVQAKRAWPLDFTAVTDHAELMGTLQPLEDPDSTLSKSETGQRFHKNPNSALAYFVTGVQPALVPAPKDLNAEEVTRNAWDLEMKAANDNYEPGTFTTFIAYEWSSTPSGRHLHRNVFFNSDHAPMPFTALQSTRPEDLWSYLESVRAQGIDCVAIPHNGNLSGGMEYDWNDSDGKPIDEAYAQRRALNEPLTEIIQNKGQSDTVPQLSPNDEFANFEVYSEIFPGQDAPDFQKGSYIREAYGRGLVLQARIGANPFKYGVVGATDIHNGLSTQDENAMAGGPFGIDPNTMLPTGEQARRSLNLLPTVSGFSTGPGKKPRSVNLAAFSSGGMTGVWAEQNNRVSIFAALKRKETFATSGVRMRVRMFAGWDYSAKMMNSPDWVSAAYAGGVVMGGDLPARPPGAPAPRFALWAVKAPDGANLDRIQIVKVWLDGDDYKQKVFDVALSGHRTIDKSTGKAAAVGNTVDLNTATYSNTIGGTQLQTLWQDPEFDPAKPAVYYARVLEIPTPRWTTLLAVKAHLPRPDSVAATIQERAWTSPIWYTPSKS